MQPLWTPDSDRVAATRVAHLMTEAGLDTYEDLHRWSIEEPDAFWRLAWDFCGVVGASGDRVMVEGGSMRETRWFPDARLNVVDTLLARTDDGPAFVFHGEAGHRRDLAWSELHDVVSQYQQLLLSLEIEPGDRVAAMMANTPDIYAVMLAAASIGAVFTSVSPDFGVAAAVDRFGQIEPRVLFASDGYHYGGKHFHVVDKVAELAGSIPSIERAYVVAYDRGADIDVADGLWSAADALAAFDPGPVHTVPLPFDHPWYVLYSSGTTGKPKCIVHRAGGVLLKHLTEQVLHCDIRPGDRVFYFTTAGWMMWNWLVGVLASEATLILYDGSPFHPDGNVLFDLADREKPTLLGISAKFVDAVNKAGLRPAETHNLSSVRTICSTGSTLVHESFRFVYEHVASDVHLASMSGGTDLCGCLVAGNPIGAVHAGEIQAPGIGLDIGVIDDEGNRLGPGEQGELICWTPFPSIPLRFVNDPGHERFDSSYFTRFPGAWHQGDFAEWAEGGGMVISGRSDATLNPGGVRIGTAEIYRQVEQLDEIEEGLVIGQAWDDDTRIVLFVRLADGVTLDDDLQQRIRSTIRTGASPRHVPARIVAVDDIPRTRSGKISELAVRDIVAGRTVKNTEALANPEALELYKELPELQV